MRAANANRADVWKFFAARAEALLGRIETATGKHITREPEHFRPGTEREPYLEELDDREQDEALEEEVTS